MLSQIYIIGLTPNYPVATFRWSFDTSKQTTSSVWWLKNLCEFELVFALEFGSKTTANAAAL